MELYNADLSAIQITAGTNFWNFTPSASKTKSQILPWFFFWIKDISTQNKKFT